MPIGFRSHVEDALPRGAPPGARLRPRAAAGAPARDPRGDAGLPGRLEVASCADALPAPCRPAPRNRPSDHRMPPALRAGGAYPAKPLVPGAIGPRLRRLGCVNAPTLLDLPTPPTATSRPSAPPARARRTLHPRLALPHLRAPDQTASTPGRPRHPGEHRRRQAERLGGDAAEAPRDPQPAAQVRLSRSPVPTNRTSPAIPSGSPARRLIRRSSTPASRATRRYGTCR